MPPDLFAATFTKQTGPRRSKWTIAGSFLAHTVLLAALLVLPVLSAFDSYVVQARNIAFSLPPPPMMPAIPAPPPKATTPVPQELNPHAAPPSPPENIVTKDAVTTNGPPVPPGSLPMGDGRSTVPGTASGPVNVPPFTPPPPVPQKPIPVGGKVSAPARLSYADPIYPRLAIAAKVDGMVILEATIDETGVVRDVKVLRSIPLLDQAAVDAVRRWRYTPTRLNGVAVPVLLTVTVTFSLR